MIKNANSLIEMVKRGLKDLRLAVAHPVLFFSFQPDNFGDVRLQDNGAATGCAVFADLYPAVMFQTDIEHHMVVAVPLGAPIGPLGGCHIRRQCEELLRETRST